jgi:5'-deoxynucleotidase YfbR-like HD superfamily hydrolase
MNIHDVIMGGCTKRYHTWPIVGDEQTVGYHSWGVAVILTMICEPSTKLLKAALFHDMAEHHVGDTPAPAKWANPRFAEELRTIERIEEERLGIDRVLEALSSQEKWHLDLADLLELCSFAYMEIKKGNIYCHRVYVNGYKHLIGKKNIHLNPVASELLSEMTREIFEQLPIEMMQEMQDAHPVPADQQ